MIIDPKSPIGKIRLRIGDHSDLPLLPDNVIESALEECSNNIPRAAALCANYILGLLAAKTHKKLNQIEVWGAEHFENYVKFLKLTILNPARMDIAPVPYAAGLDKEHPIITFINDWNEQYSCSGFYV